MKKDFQSPKRRQKNKPVYISGHALADMPQGPGDGTQFRDDHTGDKAYADHILKKPGGGQGGASSPSLEGSSPPVDPNQLALFP